MVLGAGAHSSVQAALSVLGIGRNEVEIVPADLMGDASHLPVLDDHTLLILQAGDVCGGAFDPFDELCETAKQAGAWVHIDGVLGLSAASSRKYHHLTAGIEKADAGKVPHPLLLPSQVLNDLHILNFLRSASMIPCLRSFPISADSPLLSTSR